MIEDKPTPKPPSPAASRVASNESVPTLNSALLAQLPAETPQPQGEPPEEKRSKPPLELDEPWERLAARITILNARPTRFVRGLTQGLGPGFQLFTMVKAKLRSKEWHEELRAPCPNWFVGSRSAVFDEEGRIRALTEEGGSDDMGWTNYRFFDENGQLRLLFIRSAHYSGSVSEHLVAFDPSGKITKCDWIPIAHGIGGLYNLCPEQERETKQPPLDPAVRAVIREMPPTPPAEDSFFDYLQEDPGALFRECMEKAEPSTTP